MMLEHLKERAGAVALVSAVERVMVAGEPRSGDLGGMAGTAEMADAAIAALESE